MKSWIRCLPVLACLMAAPALADLKVATSLTDLASVAQFVGGKHVTAQSLCRGFEDPHFVPAKPSLMKAIQHADVFVSTGLELDSGWLPLVLPGSRNPKIQQGAKGFVDGSQGVDILEKPSGTVSRAAGDIHPFGNPHYYADPKALIVVANHLSLGDPSILGASIPRTIAFMAKQELFDGPFGWAVRWSAAGFSISRGFAKSSACSRTGKPRASAALPRSTTGFPVGSWRTRS